MNTPYDESILRSLRRITRSIDVFSRELAKRHHLTAPQLVCIRHICSAQGASPSELAAAVDLSRATITGILDRLEARGLLVRVRSKKDRRRIGLELTPAGRMVASLAPRPLHDRFARRLAQLPVEDQEKIDEMLRRVVEMMEAQDIEAAPILSTGPATVLADAVESFLSPEGADESKLSPG